LTSQVIRLPNNWIPRQDQMDLWEYLQAGGKRAVEVAHRRWGKDDVALHFTAKEMWKRPATYWHMLPQFTQARKVIWTAVNPDTGTRRIDEAFPKALRKHTREQDMSIEFINGSVWQLVGSDNYNSLVGSPPLGIVFSEWALANPMAWAYLAPILEANGGWALFIYTSRGNNHGRTMYENATSEPGWFHQILQATDTPVFTQEQLTKIKKQYMGIFGHEYGNSLFQQEYMCSFAGAVLGSYFSRQMADAKTEGRIGVFPHQPGFEVDTAWDLGVDDSMTIWFVQHIGTQHHVIDYYESTGYGLEHYSKVMKGESESCTAEENERRKQYKYGNHYMPHDAAAREMTNSEIAKSRKEIAEELGIKPIIIVERAKNIDIIIQVQIPAARNLLPKCCFDEINCAGGISALENYKAEYDDKKKKLGNRPLHDWSSHGSSAFITFAMGYTDAGFEDFPT